MSRRKGRGGNEDKQLSHGSQVAIVVREESVCSMTRVRKLAKFRGPGLDQWRNLGSNG